MQQYTEPAFINPVTSGSLTDSLLLQAQKNPDRITIVKRDAGRWIDTSAKDFLSEVRAIAKGLVHCGVKPGDRVAIMSRTRYEWTVTDYAIWYCGGVSVPIYETSSVEQVRWILSDSAAVAVLVENDGHMAKVEEVLDSTPNLAHRWSFERGGLEELKSIGVSVPDEQIDGIRAEVKPEDTASIIYTSGTTGQPKGCVLTHGNFMMLMNNIREAIPEILKDPKTTLLLFLPLAHVFGRVIQIVFIHAGQKLAHSPDITNLVADLKVYQPTTLLAVPRVFEKIFNSAQQKAESEGKGKIFNAASGVAIAYAKAKQEGKVSLGLSVKHALFDKLVYGKLREAMGGEVKWAVSGGAALGSRLGYFFLGIGITILEGYGLTETSAAATVNRVNQLRVGSVGRAIPGISLAIAGDGEILVKGAQVFQGYWNNPTATAEAIEADGWFHTGDLGSIDNEGYLFITGRKKELIVTAGGKNVAPAVIEDRLRAHWLVSQCMVVGDNKPFVGCLITVDRDALPQWLKRHNRAADTSIEQLRHDEEFLAEMQTAVDHANKAVSQAESIRKFALVDQDWTEASGHLTPSLKLKRNVVFAQHEQTIENLYR